MAIKTYFRQIPNFEYVSRLPNSQIGDYSEVKNIFKRGKIREDILNELAYFTKYQIKGNDRPDNVAYEIYGDSNLDWVVLLSNNILNVQTEWPLPQQDFDEYLLDKYGSYDALYNGIHHYETTEVKNSRDIIILPKGLNVGPVHPISYYDDRLEQQIDIANASVPVTNYEYEEKKENDKRNIFIIKSEYLNIIFADMENIMTYREGSSQFKTETLKVADNIKIYS